MALEVIVILHKIKKGPRPPFVFNSVSTISHGFHDSTPFHFNMLINKSRKGDVAAFTISTVVLFDKLGC